MSEFGKTLIVDPDITITESGDYTSPPYYNTIKEAVDKLNPDLPLGLNGGTIIVEQGTYIIDGTNDGIDQRTITVPSNVSIIGRGNAVIEVKSTDTGGVSAFYAEDEENITISGFKIVIEDTAPSAEHTYDRHLVYMKKVKNSVIEKLYITDASTKGVNQGNAVICFNGGAGTCTGNVIQNCIIESFGKNYDDDSGLPIFHYGYGIFLSENSSHNIIRNNIIQNCSHSVYLYNDSSENIIKNNIMKDSGKKTYGINGEGELVLKTTTGSNLLIGGGGSHNNVISGNILVGSRGSHGLYLAGIEGCTICGNISNDNYDNGFKLRINSQAHNSQYNTLMGNVANGNGISNIEDVTGPNDKGFTTSGFLLGANTTYNSIVGNVSCENSAQGIDVRSENLKDHPSPDIPDGWYRCENNVVLGNVAEGNDEYSSKPEIDIITDDYIETIGIYNKNTVVNNVSEKTR